MRTRSVVVITIALLLLLAGGSPASAQTPEITIPGGVTVQDLADLLGDLLPPGVVPEIDPSSLIAEAEAAAGTFNVTERGVAGLIWPLHGQALSGTVDIAGTAASQNLWYYIVEHSTDRLTWTSVDIDYRHERVVVLDLLTAWDTTTVPDGGYWLRVRVVDNTGNFMTSRPVQVIVANVRPEPAVRAAVTPAPRPSLQVAPEDVEALSNLLGVPEEELRRYLERALPDILAELEIEPLLFDIDRAMSTVVTENTAAAGIYWPLPGQTVSGLVHIVGSAASQHFLYSKVEYLAPGGRWEPVGAGYVQPVMVPVGWLTSWDTTQVANGLYWLRVVVVDDTGNFVSSNPSRVIVRNTGGR